MSPDKLLDYEQSVVGKQGLSLYKDPKFNINSSYFSIVIAIIVSGVSFFDNLSAEGTSIKALIFITLVSLATFLAFYLTIVSVVKFTFR